MLSLSTKRRGGAYMRDVDATFSLVITGALPRSRNVLVLALPFHHGDFEPDCSSFDENGERGPSVDETRGREMLPTLTLGWRASALRAEAAGRFRKVAGVSIVAAGGPRLR